MAKFSYKAKKGLDQIIEGVVEAPTQDEALNRLVAQGLFPTSISESVGVKAKPERARHTIRVRKKAGAHEILLFTQKLETLIRAKVELLSSLRIIYEQTEDSHLKDVIHQIYEATKGGKTFSESLEGYPKIFSPLYVNIIKAGETSGRLDYALEQIAEFLLRDENLKTKIRVALAYPILLLSVGSISIFVLISFVIPKLRPIFEGISDQLPLITKIVLHISTFSSKTWFWMLGGVLVAILMLYSRRGSPFYNNLIRKLKISAPVVKRLIKNQELAHFCRSFALLINSGVVALKSLEIATLTIENPKLKAELGEVYKEVASGQSLARSMETLTSLPKFLTKMLAVGEESGKIGETLEEILRSYNQQIETDIMLISSLLEPVLILGLGGILGTIVLSILLPTFQVTQIVH